MERETTVNSKKRNDGKLQEFKTQYSTGYWSKIKISQISLPSILTLKIFV